MESQSSSDLHFPINAYAIGGLFRKSFPGPISSSLFPSGSGHLIFIFNIYIYVH